MYRVVFLLTISFGIEVITQVYTQNNYISFNVNKSMHHLSCSYIFVKIQPAVLWFYVGCFGATAE